MQITTKTIYSEEAGNKLVPLELLDYSELLKRFGVTYKPLGYHLQVGEINKIQGWILHISVIKAQFHSLLSKVIPELVELKVPFKIVRNCDVAGFLLEGNLGYTQLGKMMSIYPRDDEQAVFLVDKLIYYTSSFKGPAIPTDILLGSAVYTRYGSFKPLLIKDESGQPTNYIYSSKGELIPDKYTIPFRVPEGVSWPFGKFASPLIPKPSKLLNHSYYPIALIKPDAKGNVFKALYFKRLWQIKSCLIKEGKQNMFADEFGRDIQDRLQWQCSLQRELGKDIPLPKIFDYFEDNGNSYIAMEFIKGQSLTSWLKSICADNCWPDLVYESQLKLLDYLLKILNIIACLHNKGYIHRDITIENFLISNKGKILLIDMELTWSSFTETPNPPFRLGSPGYMSPEQARNKVPTTKDDVYSIGALMIVFFTNLSPLKFSREFPLLLQKNLSFFTGYPIIFGLIADCLKKDPEERPGISTIQNTLGALYKKIKENLAIDGPSDTLKKTPNGDLRQIIQEGINGLVNQQMISIDQLWFSPIQRTQNLIGNEQLEVTYYPGFHTGLAGILYLISKGKKCGFDVGACKIAFGNSLDFINTQYFKKQKGVSPGLFMGSAGIGVSIAEALNSGLLQPDIATIDSLHQCFSQLSTNLDLASGVAGQGLALLSCSSCLDKRFVENRLRLYVETILNSQHADGSWPLQFNGAKTNDIITGIDLGVAGIVLFLLNYIQYNADIRVKDAAIKGLEWFRKHATKKGNSYSWTITTKSKHIDPWTCSNGIPGIMLIFLRAYEVLKNPLYKSLVKRTLQNIPARPVRADYTLAAGMAGLAEVYLEADRVFDDAIWQGRANWIVEVFVHSFQKVKEDQGYWWPSLNNPVTADLFIGNSGILHVLMRYLNPNKLNHILLPESSENKHTD